MDRTKEQFMAAMRGIPTHQITMAMTQLIHGHNYGGCTKALLADIWIRKRNGAYEIGETITLDLIKEKINEIYLAPLRRERDRLRARLAELDSLLGD